MDRMQVRLVLMAVGVVVATMSSRCVISALYTGWRLTLLIDQGAYRGLGARPPFTILHGVIFVGFMLVLAGVQFSLGYWLLIAHGPRMQWLIRRIIP